MWVRPQPAGSIFAAAHGRSRLERGPFLEPFFDRDAGRLRAPWRLLLQYLTYMILVPLLANVLAAIPLIVLFLLLARLWDVRPPWVGYIAVLPALVLAGLMLGAFGLLLSSLVPRLENFAGVMNFVIFPMFFASTALYPLWRLEDASLALATVARFNPFTHAVELIRFALYLRLEPVSLAVTLGTFVLFFALAVLGYDPGRGLWRRRTT